MQLELDHQPYETPANVSKGPGMRCAPPQNYPFAHTVIDKGYEMFFLDQRGTGLSTPVTASTLQMRGTTDVQAKYCE